MMAGAVSLQAADSTSATGRLFFLPFLGGGLAVITSDVVGPDSPEGSHQRMTAMPALRFGLDAGYDVVRTDEWVLTVRTRLAVERSAEGSAVVHTHRDVIPATPTVSDVVVLTDHGVRHRSDRLDLAGLVSVAVSGFPVRFSAGITSSIDQRGTVTEVYRELSRTPVQPPEVDHEDALNEAISERFVTARSGLLLALEIPFTYGPLTIVPALEADVQISATVEDDIVYSHHLIAATLGLQWRL
jgi:hypothetical protein